MTPRHGTVNGYVNRKCRCKACRVAWTDEFRRMRARRFTRITPDDPRHGTYTFYENHSCRCDACRAANTAFHAKQRAKAKS